MTRSRKNRCASLNRRRTSPGWSGKTILIVTEGEKTEPDYLNGLRNHLKLHTADIRVITSEGTDPLSVVDSAIIFRDERKKLSRRGSGVPYDSAWAVFDTERAKTNPKLNAAIQKAKDNNISIAISNPCFEFWLLLHYEYTTAPFSSCANIIRRIKDNHLPGYEKEKIPVNEFIARIPEATNRAGKCRQHVINANTDGNPSTDMDLLVKEMNQATRAHFRMDLN